ncbi:hypothetical protein LJC20_05600 [Eubacteriales bacterium OttesenSCG-928-M02]|nr:hypothetical protein [Eubacteriales bacterium OttesenSCG-928-M02]
MRRHMFPTLLLFLLLITACGRPAVLDSAIPSTAPAPSLPPPADPADYLIPITDKTFLSLLEKEAKKADSIATEDHFQVFINTPVVFTPEQGAHFEENLRKKGWENHAFSIFSDVDDGFYGLSCHDWAEEPHPPAQVKERGDAFLKDSGIQAILDDLDMAFETEVVEYIVFYHAVVDGQRTGAYIRLSFQNDTLVNEGVFSLYTTQPAGAFAALPIETAVANAAYHKGCDEEEPVAISQYYPSGFSLAMVDGFPFYQSSALGKEVACVFLVVMPAIDEADLKTDPDLWESYLRALEKASQF